MENIYRNLLESLKAGNSGVVYTRLQPNQGDSEIIEKGFISEKDLGIIGTESYRAKDFKNEELEIDKIRIEGIACIEAALPKLVENEGNDRILFEPFFPEERLIIFGGGHISQPLVKFGAEIGFSVVVIDDRPSFANTDRFPEANLVICESYDRCFKKINITKTDFVVIVTRGHRHDVDCLKQVLEINPRYMGMIGSKRRVGLVREGLVLEGYKKELVDRVHSPIGLSIGAVTPAEIAISIIAQIISIKRLGEEGATTGKIKKVNSPDIDYAVLEKLGEESKEKKAVITIVSTKGSTPRHAGAKMLVWNDGRTVGSIGGGCSEADVTRIARELIADGGYRFYKIDMTGTYAEEEGMVCGGTMDVLIEVC